MEQKFATEIVELPSKGLLYPEDNPLSSGKIELKYMTAKEEDILTNQSYISNGTVLDKLLQSLIVDKSINYNDILIGDKNAIMIAARVLGYGPEYSFEYNGETHEVNLAQLYAKPIDESLFTRGKNEFSYTLPATGTEITFKLLTHGDEQKIDQEIKGLQKLKRDAGELTTRLKHMITSIGGNTSPQDIRDFVDNRFLARDARAFRKHVNEIQPDIDLKFYPDGAEEGITIPITLNFFWPDI
jgi:hypothetical protein